MIISILRIPDNVLPRNLEQHTQSCSEAVNIDQETTKNPTTTPL